MFWINVSFIRTYKIGFIVKSNKAHHISPK